MNINDCRKQAEQRDLPGMTDSFIIYMGTGKYTAKWLDVWLGAFVIDGMIGVFYSKEIQNYPHRCENKS
jgi:hypothetical protein